MKVYVLMVGYEADVVRVFTTAEACDRAANEYGQAPISIEEAEVEDEA